MMVPDLPQVLVGDSFGAVRRLTQTDLDLAVDLTGGRHPVHVDEHAARDAGLGGCIFHGAVSAAIMASAIGAHFSRDRIALLGQDNLYRLPVYPGDELQTSWTVTEVRPTRQKGRILITLTGQMRNQHGAVVLDATTKLMWFSPGA